MHGCKSLLNTHLNEPSSIQASQLESLVSQTICALVEYHGTTQLTCNGLYCSVGHVIKPGMETGNEMERNEINLQCSGGYSLRNLNNNSTAFTDLKAQCEYRWYRRFAQGFAAVYEDSNNLMRCILHGLCVMHLRVN